MSDEDETSAIPEDWRLAYTEPVAIPVLRPRLPSAERLLPYLRRIDETRIYSNRGPLACELEERLARHFELPPGTVVSACSGTSALIGAILASTGWADERRPLALIPALSFVATASAVEQCGYRVLLADVDGDTWMLDPTRIVRDVGLDRVGLVVPVASFGRPVAQEPWQDFSASTGIPIVIDGAASFETVSAFPQRSLGPIPVALSFHATKSFATGEGGAVVSTNVPYGERVVRALNFGFYGSRDSTTPSTNGKMSEYNAAVGLAELDEWLAKSKSLGVVSGTYRAKINDVGLSDRLVAAPDIASCYVLFRSRNLAEAVRVRAELSRVGIDYRLWYGAGLHRQSRLEGAEREETLAVSEGLALRLVGLPMAPDLSDDSIALVVRALTAGVAAADSP